MSGWFAMGFFTGGALGIFLASVLGSARWFAMGLFMGGALGMFLATLLASIHITNLKAELERLSGKESET